MPGGLCYRLEDKNARGRGEALVHLYAGAAADVAGVLQGVQERPDLAR